MDPAEISRRLKAGRWLAGGVKDDGKPTPLTTAELARREPLAQNGISVNRIEEIEQLKLPNGARPMELEKIAQALGMPNDWFSVEKVAPPRPDTVAIEPAAINAETQDRKGWDGHRCWPSPDGPWHIPSNRWRYMLRHNTQRFRKLRKIGVWSPSA